MTKEWCQNIQSVYDCFRFQKEKEIRALCSTLNFLPDKIYNRINSSSIDGLSLALHFADVYMETEEQKNTYKTIIEKLLKFYKNYGYTAINFFTLTDSEPKKYDGDIIITDPCYLTKDEDWHKICDKEFKLEDIIPSIIYRDTIYGDWSCSTYFNNTHIGDFCADTGLVCVALLEDILKYNPNFDYHINKPWTTTLIKNFQGEIKFEVLYNGNRDILNIASINSSTDISSMNNFLERREIIFEDFEIQVVGTGINKITKESFNFFTTQTAF